MIQVMSQAIAASVKERLNELAIDTEQIYREKAKKRLVLISPEFLIGK